MSRYLLTIRCSAARDPLEGHPAPAEYALETVAEPEAEASDGLEHWVVDLQLAGSLADWSRAPAYDAFWSYLHNVLATIEVRPRVALRIRSRFDPHSVSIAIAYLGDHEIKRAAESVRQKIEAAIEPKSKKMKADLSFAF